MTYWIAQAFGILATVVCLLLPMMKHKWQMLIFNALTNLFAGANIFLLGQASALPVYIVAIVQVILTLWHMKRERPIRKWENILFLFLYLGCGLATARSPLDILPPIGAVFNMLATFQMEEQRSRLFVLLNSSVFVVFYFLMGSTSIFSALIGVGSSAAALYRYRKA